MFDKLLRKLGLKKDKGIEQEETEPVTINEDETTVYTPRITKEYAPYNIIGVDEEHDCFRYKNGRLSDYTVEDIIQVKEAIDDYNAFPDIKSFNSLLPFSNTVISRILWNIENGVYDEWLPEDSD